MRQYDDPCVCGGSREWTNPDCERCDLIRDLDALVAALKHARIACRDEYGITTRKFARMCGISPTQLSEWTADIPAVPPDIA